MTPPSELIRPPSKAAVIFLRWTTGKRNGRRLSSVMAGVACLDPGKGLASATESYARSNAYATSVTANPPRHEYDGLEWFPRLYRKDFTVALNFTGDGIDDPDQNLYENYTCGAEGNYIKFSCMV